jgi:hypothetical protein
MPFHRGKPSVPVLRLEISDSTFVTPPSTPRLAGDEPSPSSREKGRALSNASFPSRRPSQDNATSITSPLLSPTHVLPRAAPPPGISKARDESQKLLAHVLEQLRHRPKCPSSYSPPLQAAPAAKPIIPRLSASRTTSEQSLIPENEESFERSFSPDTAFDLMNRLRDVLVISLTHGWQIFSERCVPRKMFLAVLLISTPPAVPPWISSEVAKS